MANNFHDQAGLYVVGVDGHVGLHFPPLVVSTFFVSITAVHPFILGGNKQPTVLMNGGRPSVVDQHNPKFLWPHIGVSPDPLDMFTPIHIIFGEQKCWLPRLAVHICGTPAAPTAITGPISINTECWEFCMLPLSLVFQDGTVQTTPSPEDYKAGVIRYLVEAAIDLVIFFATGGFGDGPIAFSKSGLAPAYRQFQNEIVGELRDKGIETAGREGFQNISNAINKSVRDEFVGALFFDPPGSKFGWLGLAANTAKDGFGVDFGETFKSVMAGDGLPSMNWNWGDAGQTVLNKFVPVSGPVGDAMDLRAEQQQINQAAN
ncbi:MAG: hypothetical protein IPM54_04115 [Polyangiaceae bacterium]|nr:hypothetical protein [Polyangiaceae bacterium]